MDEIFITQLFLSFLIGGLFVTACTVIAQRFGSKIGGLIGGFPSTVIVSLFFIGLVESPVAAANATSIIPLIVGYNGLFLATYSYFARKSFLAAIGTALGQWFLLFITTLKLGVQSFALSLILYGLIFLFLVFWVKRKIIAASAPNKSIRFTLNQIGIRFIFSGAIIATAVYLSKISGTMIGGAISVFPIVFISSLTIGYVSEGREFSIALSNNMMLSSMINIVAYAVCVRYFFPCWGVATGTCLAIFVSICTACAVHFIVKKNMLLPKRFIQNDPCRSQTASDCGGGK